MRVARSLSLVMLVLALAAPVVGEEDHEYGSIIHNGVEMEVEGVVAVWNEEKGQLSFNLFPFEPDAAEIELCQRGREGRIEHALVDRERWPYRNPRAYYSLSWSEPKQRGDHGESRVFLYAYNIGGDNANVNLNYMMSFGEENVQGTLTGKVAPGEEVHLVASGEDELAGEPVKWNLDIRTKILPSLPRD